MEYILNIYRDTDAESPREWGNRGTMACFHGRYNLGDKDVPTMDEVKEIATSRDYISLPLYLYDHGGITMSCSPFSCPWDSGQVGVIFVSTERVRKEYGVKRISKKLRERVIGYLQGEVETYDQYLTGDVYGYELVRYEDDGAEIEEGSCWGFYGSDPATNGMTDHLPVPLDQMEVRYVD